MEVINPRPRMGRTRRSLGLLLAGAMCAGPAAAASNVVDIMFVYTPGAAQYGGNMETRLNQYIAQSNQAFQASDVDIELRMVHSVQSNNNTYKYTGNAALNQITYNDTAIHRLRDDYGADFVGLLNLSPGGLCGVGWLGQSSGGRITNTSKNMAYTSSAIDCGYLTFTHELGHNMGLMHSRRQGDNSGGHHAYGMGYGVDRSFATLMAYAHLFNANHVYRFSNPRQSCNGQACGNASTADSSRSLGLMASQYPDYRPTQVDPGPGDPGPEPDDELPVPPQGDNVVANPSFEGTMSPWSGVYGAQVSLNDVRRRGGKSSAHVTSRANYAGGIAQTLTGKLESGQEYDVSLWMRLGRDASDSARVVLEIDGGSRYIDLGVFGVTGGWSEIEGSFTSDVTSGNDVRLLVYGPGEGMDFFVDSVDISPVGSGADSTNLVRNGDFESGTAASWATGFGGKIDISSDGYQSSRSLRLTERTDWHDSVGQELDAEALDPRGRYRASAQVKLDGGNDTASLWLLIRDDSGWYWQRLAWANGVAGSWVPLVAEDFSFDPVGEVQSVALHVMGPASGISMKIDDVVLEPVL